MDSIQRHLTITAMINGCSFHAAVMGGRKDYSKRKREMTLCKVLSDYFWRKKHFLSLMSVFVSSSITGYDLTTLYNEPYIIILTGTGNRHPLLSRSVQRLRSLSQRNFLAFSRFGVNDPPHQSFYIWFHGALNGTLQSYILTMNRRKKTLRLELHVLACDCD